MELKEFLPFHFRMNFRTVSGEVFEVKFELFPTVSFSALHSVANYGYKLFVFKTIC